MGSPTTDVLTQRLADQIAEAQQSSKPNVILAGNLRRIAQGQPGPKSFITACSSLGRLGLSDEFLESVYSQVSTDKSNGTPSNVRLQDSGRASEVRREEAEAAAALAEAPGGLFIPKREPGGRRNNGARQEQSPVDRNSAGSQSRSPKRIKLEHVNGGDGGQLSGRSSMPPPPRPVSPAPAPSREEHRSSSPRIKREPAEGKPIPYFKREIHSRSSTPHSRSKIESRDFPDPASREEQLAQDREWYTSDETGPVLGDDTGNPFDGFDDFGVKYKADGRSVQNKFRYSDQKLMQRKRDDDAWETNRMLTSGVAQRRDFGGREADDDDQNETRIHLLVHDVKPPFLEKHRIYTKQLEPVSAVRDPQSDLAVLSRKGSVVVRERRQQRERTRQAQAATTAAGSTLGNIMGVEEEDSTQPEATNTSGSGKNRFSEHMGSTGNATALEISQAVQNLPVFAVQEEFLEIVAENQVLIVVGETGSGKTTQLGQMLYRAGYTSQGGAIVCTQPRRVAAVSVAKRVAEEMDTKLGALVGYSIRFENVTSAETVIRYVSEGVLLREFLTDSELNNVSVVILDEAHERSLNCDILLGLIKRVLIKRRDIKLIVTSATLNSRRFSDFFAQAPVFHIPGRTYPVDVQFARSPTEDYVDAAVRQLLSIHVSQGPGDMLCFMTGQEDILATCELVGERLKLLNDPPKLLVLPLYSQLAADLQARIFQKAPPGVRKLIVSTNVCETSVTVDGIIYVVDAGFSKLKVYNPRIGMDTLQITPISQANANQRSGRAGRTAAGKAYRLFTERAYKDEMYIATIPEIQRTNITNTVLLLKSLGVDDLLDFDFMDSPPQEAITTSLFDLWALGAIDNLGALTPLGKSMTSFPMDPPLAKLLITSASRSPYACSDEILTIVAMLSVPAVFYRPRERMEEADATREKFFAAESDHLTLLNVYNQWRANGCADGWCARHFLHPQALRRAREIREQIAELMTGSSSSSSRRGADGVKKGGAGGGGGGGHKGAGLEILSCGRDTDVIRKCVAGSFYFQAAKLKGRGEYVNLRTSVTVQLHPTSALYGAGVLPEYIVYHDLVMTSKEYISTATAVEPGWLAELGFVFFSVRKRVYGGADPGEGDEGGGTGRGREKRMVELEIGRRMEMQVKMEGDREKDRTKRRAAQEEREKMGPGKVGRAGFGKEEKTVVVQGEVRKAVVKKRRMGV